VKVKYTVYCVDLTCSIAVGYAQGCYCSFVRVITAILTSILLARLYQVSISTYVTDLSPGPVCRSVCLSVCGKSAEWIRMPLGWCVGSVEGRVY